MKGLTGKTLLFTALTIFNGLGSGCKADLNADSIARALADRLADALEFDDGEKKGGPPPAEHDSASEYPVLTTMQAPATLYPGQRFEVRLSTDFIAKATLYGAAVYVERAGKHTIVRKTYDTEADAMVLTGYLREARDLVGHVFTVKVALLDDMQRAGRYAVWRLAIVNPPVEEPGDAESLQEADAGDRQMEPDAVSEPDRMVETEHTPEFEHEARPRIEVLVDASVPLAGASIHSGFLYYTEPGDLTGRNGRVLRVPVTGGTPEVLAEGQAYPNSVAADDSRVCWTNQASGEVVLKPFQQNPVVIAQNQSSPGNILVQSSGIYWLNREAGDVMLYRFDIQEFLSLFKVLPPAGGLAVNGFYITTTVLHDESGNERTGQVYLYNTNTQRNILITGKAASPKSVAMDEKQVYWLDEISPDGAVYASDLGASNIQTLAKQQDAPSWVAVDNEWVYFAVSNPLAIRRVSKQGGEVQDLFTGLEGAVSGIYLDQTHVYWIIKNRLFRAPK